ncbi:MAG: S26 family signal peptidase [Pirellulaceae bacterium]
MAGQSSRGKTPPRLVPLLPWLVLFLVLIAGALWLLRPRLPAAIEITGHSMLPTLWGSSLEMPCQDCGYPLRCSSPLDATTILCPNCGFAENLASSATEQEPDRVQLNPLPRGSGPFRWDLVAIRLPGESGYAVKRVVGLPGELIRIQGGEIYVDEQLLQKNWQLFEQLRVEVHHLGYRPASQLRRPASPDDGPSNWKPLHQPSGWTSSYPFHFQPREEGTWDHLVLERQPAIPGLVTPPDQPLRGIVDYQPANQGLARPRLHAVRDVMVEADLTATPRARFRLEIRRGDIVYRAELDLVDRLVRLYSGPDVLASAPLPPSTDSRWKIGLAVYDRQLVMTGAAGNHLVPLKIDREGDGYPVILLGASGAAVQLKGLRVWRDVHYLGPDLTDESWNSGRILGKEEYFLLGDNMPVSEDSRQWRTSIDRHDILGTVR